MKNIAYLMKVSGNIFLFILFVNIYEKLCLLKNHARFLHVFQKIENVPENF